VKKLLISVALALTAICGTAAAASATVTPEPCLTGSATCSAVAPRTFWLMVGPYAWMTSVHWSHWSATWAKGSGILRGADSYRWRFGPATVTLYRPVKGWFTRAFVRCNRGSNCASIHTGVWHWSRSVHIWEG
jgi:hypothetical protein